ncbi:hypothetical protein SEA_ATUIN_261 [Arthrobacter phage Atuin]|nr:hypothetical protein SEA_ATUIN_60 [Arthrobacter phage Atuin]
MNKQAKVRIAFDAATQEAFEVFADEVAEHLPKAEVTFQDKPIVGSPYIWVRHNIDDHWNGWVFSIDQGQSLCIGENENDCWVEHTDPNV